MLTYKDILTSFTKKLGTAFSDVNIYVDDTVNGVKSSCFYVQLIPLPSVASTKNTDNKSLLVSIKYYQETKGKKSDLYNVVDSLNNTFVRGVQVKDRYLKFDNIEPNVLKDEVGHYLDFLISISYIDNINTAIEEVDFASEMILNNDIKY